MITGRLYYKDVDKSILWWPTQKPWVFTRLQGWQVYSSKPTITCSELAIKTPERRHRRRFGVFIVNFEHISNLVPVFIVNFKHIWHLVLVFLLLTLSMQMPAGFLSVCADLVEALLVLRYRSQILLLMFSELISLTPEIIRKHGFLMTTGGIEELNYLA